MAETFPLSKTTLSDNNEKRISTPDLIKLNIGGQSFCCKIATLKSRAFDSKLARFVQSSHEAKLFMCDAYFMETNEYFFERTPKLFASIYKYYSSGALHRPLDVCEVEFYTELVYWNISEDQISPCCWPRSNHLSDSLDDLSNTSKKRSLENLTLRERIYAITEGDGTICSLIFTSLSIGFVLISVLGLVLGSIHEFQVPINKKGNISKRYNDTEPPSPIPPGPEMFEPHPFFDYVETTCIVWFTIEYCLRIFVAPKKISFVFELLNIVDLIAILPFYLELSLTIFGFDSSSLKNVQGAFLVVRILRVLRVVRILKLGRYSAGMRTFALTLRSSAKQLGMMGMVLCTGVIFFSTLIYYVEKDEPLTQFTSIPSAFWFVLVTMTTVGYGDSVPITTAGKLIASGAIVSGVLVLALPITIIVDSFMRVSGSHQPTSFGPPKNIPPNNNNNNNFNHGNSSFPPPSQSSSQHQQHPSAALPTTSSLSRTSPTNSISKKPLNENIHFTALKKSVHTFYFSLHFTKPFITILICINNSFYHGAI
uniref:BTB domain-containing protein n=1 Tax=Panagrolaimus sp. PS1159 TaxID=55785 RepID=A0AC35FFH3_9BILA